MTPLATFFIAAALAGIAAFQGPINAQLASRTGVTAANVLSNVVGTAGLLLLMGVLEPEAFCIGYWKTRIDEDLLPLPLWLGGLLGSLFMVTMVMAVPRLGAAGWTLAALAGQLTAGLVIDLVGWFGVNRNPIGWQQIIGLLIVFVGASLFLTARPSP